MNSTDDIVDALGSMNEPTAGEVPVAQIFARGYRRMRNRRRADRVALVGLVAMTLAGLAVVQRGRGDNPEVAESPSETGSSATETTTEETGTTLNSSPAQKDNSLAGEQLLSSILDKRVALDRQPGSTESPLPWLSLASNGSITVFDGCNTQVHPHAWEVQASGIRTVDTSPSSGSSLNCVALPALPFGILELVSQSDERIELTITHDDGTVVGAEARIVRDTQYASANTWVITSDRGRRFRQTIMPWFRFNTATDISGYDGCNRFDLDRSKTRTTETAMSCRVDTIALRPDTYPVVEAPWQARSGSLIAQPLNDFEVPSADRVSGLWATPDGNMTLNLANGSVSVNGCNEVGSWRLVRDKFVPALNRSVADLISCLDTDAPAAAAILEQLATGEAVLRESDDGDLIVWSNDLVTWLVPIPAQ